MDIIFLHYRNIFEKCYLHITKKYNNKYGRHYKSFLQEQIQLKYTEYKFACTSLCVSVSVSHCSAYVFCTIVIPSLSLLLSLRSRYACLHQCVCVFVCVYVWLCMFGRVWAGTSEFYIRPFLVLSLLNSYSYFELPRFSPLYIWLKFLPG